MKIVLQGMKSVPINIFLHEDFFVDVLGQNHEVISKGNESGEKGILPLGFSTM